MGGALIPDEDAMDHHAGSRPRFRYEKLEIDPAGNRLVCSYSLGSLQFTETVSFPAGGDWNRPGIEAAARWVHLLAGVSYYKAAAPLTVDLGRTAATDAEMDLLRMFLVEGLGEFAYRNGLDLSPLSVTGRAGEASATGTSGGARGHEGAQGAGRPLIPFGGGIDSVVTMESVRARHPGAELFVVTTGGHRYSPIERTAARSGLKVVRAERTLDPKILRSAELGFYNGHVPITGIISALAVLAALLGGHDAVIMSNERSASAGNMSVGGREVNHQWSKGWEFEEAFSTLVADTLEGAVRYFSLLRPFSELWVARQFAGMSAYHREFQSCNRAYAVDPARRMDRWCGTCDKCCFVDLVLAPFVTAEELSAIFSGTEPLANPALIEQFRALLGLGGPKPFECVGDVTECRVALQAAAGWGGRPGGGGEPDGRGTGAAMRAGPDGPPSRRLLLETLAGELQGDQGGAGPSLAALLRPLGPHRIPSDYAPADLLG